MRGVTGLEDFRRRGASEGVGEAVRADEGEDVSSYVRADFSMSPGQGRRWRRFLFLGPVVEAAP